MPDSLLDQDVRDAFATARQGGRRRVQIDGRAVDLSYPFPSPPDWRDQWVYFLMVDRFNNPNGAPRGTWNQPFGGYQGGTLEGVRRQLDYLARLGAGAIWLTPVLQNPPWADGSYHGYGIQHFLRVNPRLASNPADAEAELQTLIDEAHARGLYVIFDIVLNHAGDVFAYLKEDGSTANEAPWESTPYRIQWRDELGAPRPEWESAPPAGAPGLTPGGAVWPNELRRNGAFRRQGLGGESGGDFASLKELITADEETRRTLILIHQWVIARFDIDGFRIDTLKYIEPEFARVFGNAMREFALEIGKKNFFTFGEVYDNEETIARFIGRHALDRGDLTGVDAALDFPLFYLLPAFAKGFVPPAEIVRMFERRKEVQAGIVSSHGEASRYFVTFLDNHDQSQRFRFEDQTNPLRFDDQVTQGLACLFALQGIPCIYYGTEQGLCGRGGGDAAVREALWGRPGGFDVTHPLFGAIETIAGVRATRPALRYGRQYFRPVSGDRRTFGISSSAPGVLAISRVLNEDEVVIIANAGANDPVSVSVIVDANLHSPGDRLRVLYSNKSQANPPEPVERLSGVRVHEVDGATGFGPLHAIRVDLQPSEVQILGG
jgi:glycosidase